MNMLVVLFWIVAVALRFAVVLTVERKLDVKAQMWVAIVSASFSFFAGYIFHKIGAHGAFANVAAAAGGFFIHFGIQKLYKIQKN